MQFTCSTVIRILDFVFEQEVCIIGSPYGKKKKKHVSRLNQNSGTGKNALSFLSSILDILLLKKDLKNRFATRLISALLISGFLVYYVMVAFLFTVMPLLNCLHICFLTGTNCIIPLVYRTSLIRPLFKLLRKMFMDDSLQNDVEQDVQNMQASSGISQSVSNIICYNQQTLLSILEDISASLSATASAKVASHFARNRKSLAAI